MAEDTRRMAASGKMIGTHGNSGTLWKNYKAVRKATAKKVARQSARLEVKSISE